jgi:hypothetical protein
MVVQVAEKGGISETDNSQTVRRGRSCAITRRLSIARSTACRAGSTLWPTAESSMWSSSASAPISFSAGCASANRAGISVAGRRARRPATRNSQPWIDVECRRTGAADRLRKYCRHPDGARQRGRAKSRRGWREARGEQESSASFLPKPFCWPLGGGMLGLLAGWRSRGWSVLILTNLICGAA